MRQQVCDIPRKLSLQLVSGKKRTPHDLATEGAMKAFTGDETSTIESKSIPETPVDFNRNVFIPTWENKPEEVKPIIIYNGAPILTFQNTTGIIAPPGMGKSSLCEAVAASYLNPSVDALGFAVSRDFEGILLIDNERTVHDVWNSFYRMSKRAQIRPGQQVEDVTIAGLRAIPRLNERLKTIEYLLEQRPYSLLILDGAGDLVTDSNDLLQAIECRIWLREITVKYNLSILTTIHPNSNSNKPRGHIGSEVHRECECVLLAKKIGDTRVLTTDFEFGKNRNHSHISGGFRWSDEQKMFISADVESIAEVLEQDKNERKRREAERISLKVLAPPAALSYTDLVAAIVESENCAEVTAKRRIKEMKNFNFIKTHTDGLLRADV